MPSAHLFSDIVIIVIAAFVGGFTARSLSLPPILGYIASGIIFSAIGTHIFSSYPSMTELSEIGVALLLFTLGFEFSLDKIKKIDKKVIYLGCLQVILTAVFFIPLFFLFSFDFKTGILFSVLFSFSSTAVVVKLLEEKGLQIGRAHV